MTVIRTTASGATRLDAFIRSLVARAARGEAFVIARAGKPQVMVVPLDPAQTGPASRLGFMQGEFSVPDDFDRMGFGACCSSVATTSCP